MIFFFFVLSSFFFFPINIILPSPSPILLFNQFQKKKKKRENYAHRKMDFRPLNHLTKTSHFIRIPKGIYKKKKKPPSPLPSFPLPNSPCFSNDSPSFSTPLSSLSFFNSIFHRAELFYVIWWQRWPLRERDF